MAEITIPFPFGDLPLTPELTGRVKVSDVVTQTLATLLGWDGSSRRLVKTARSGALQVASPQAVKVIHQTATVANQVKTFGDIPITEVMIMGHPDNTGLVWVDIADTPSVTDSWPLGSGDVLKISLDNLNRLQVKIIVEGERVVILYTR